MLKAQKKSESKSWAAKGHRLEIEIKHDDGFCLAFDVVLSVQARTKLTC